MCNEQYIHFSWWLIGKLSNPFRSIVYSSVYLKFSFLLFICSAPNFFGCYFFLSLSCSFCLVQFKGFGFPFHSSILLHVFVNLIGLVELILSRRKIKSQILSGLQSSYSILFLFTFAMKRVLLRVENMHDFE